jgi:hypothetical protein
MQYILYSRGGPRPCPFPLEPCRLLSAGSFGCSCDQCLQAGAAIATVGCCELGYVAKAIVFVPMVLELLGC